MTTMTKTAAALSTLLLLGSACGDGQDDGQDDGPGSSPGTALSDKDAVLVGNALASKIAQHAYLSREMVVAAVYQATIQGGRSGQESKTDYKIKGEIESKGMKLTVDERHFFQLVAIGEAVTHSIDENRNTLVTDGTEYRWVDTSVTKVFRTVSGRMMPVFDAAEKWKATGKVLKNGKAFGSYKIGVGGKSVDVRRKYHGTIDIVVSTSAEEITLQSFRGS